MRLGRSRRLRSVPPPGLSVLCFMLLPALSRTLHALPTTQACRSNRTTAWVGMVVAARAGMAAGGESHTCVVGVSPTRAQSTYYQRLVASVRPPAGHERASPRLPLTTHLDLGLPAQYKHTALHATAALVALATALLFCFSKLLGVLPAC